MREASARRSHNLPARIGCCWGSRVSSCVGRTTTSRRPRRPFGRPDIRWPRNCACATSSTRQRKTRPCSCSQRRNCDVIEAILWDNDGVLVDTEHLYFQATQHVLASVGIRLTRKEYIELFLVQGRGAWHLAEEHGIAPADIDRLRNQRNALYG